MLRNFQNLVQKYGKSSLFQRKLHHLVKQNDLKRGITEDQLDTLEKYASLRKSVNNIPEIRAILVDLQATNSAEDQQQLNERLQKELLKLPNQTHPKIMEYGHEPKTLQTYNPLPDFGNVQPKSFDEIAKKVNLLRMDHLGNFSGHKSYYFMGALAEMEQALIQYTIQNLRPIGFKMISVPDILPAEVIEGCGMQTSGERNQVYKLETGECLSGTSEMALAGYFKDKILLEKDLPLKLVAVSRCFRAETSGLHEEKGIYRVHQFTKVEMFSVCCEDQSDATLELFKNTEIEIFKKLGIHFKLLDMPANELGAPAYRKYDIESWMPGRKMWGEISSCSNCTDYQAKRLNIKYKSNDGQIRFAHTVNGTACAIPRLLISLLETFQNENGVISIPVALQKHMRGQTEIRKQKHLPELKLVKAIHSELK